MNKDGRALRAPRWPEPLPGPRAQTRKKGLLLSHAFCSPQSSCSHRHPEDGVERQRPWGGGCAARAHRARTSAPRFPAPPAGRMPGGVEHPLWVPGRGQTLSQAPLSGSATWGGRGLGNRGGSLAPSSSHDCVLLSVLPFPAPPGCRPAPPQHQGSREALPRHRLSLRCQALWMRLRASSNFLLEDSWMALWGRSTW